MPRNSALAGLVLGIIACQGEPMSPPAELPTLHYATVSIPLSSKPTAVAARDLDGDGAIDLLVASDGAISLLRNSGGGDFPASPSAMFPGGMLPRDLMIDDYNADGQPDFAFFQHAFPHVHVYLNQGSGVFPMMASGKYAVFNTRSPFGAAAGDLNGDGKADFLVSALDSRVVLSLLNKGDGSFATDGGTPYPTLASPMALTLGDVNADGHVDAVVALYEQDQVTVIPNRGDGTFPLDGGASVAVGAGPSAMLSLDLNRDGILDLAVTTEAADKLVVLLNQGAGSFPSTNNAYRTGRRPVALAAGDLDADGHPDLAVVSASGELLTLLLNQGNGSFARAVVEPSLPDGGGPAGVTIADLNRDGLADLVITLSALNQILVMLRQPTP